MALIPLNTFKTKTAGLGTDSNTGTIYTAPIGVTSIVLMTQVTNITTQTAKVSFGHYRRLQVLPDAQGLNGQPGLKFTPMVTGFAVPGNDAASLTTGKVIIESLDSLRAWSDTPEAFTIVLSILETANA